MFDDLDHRAFTGVEVIRQLARRRGEDAPLMLIVFTRRTGRAGRMPGEHGARAAPAACLSSQTPQVCAACRVYD
ncbi:hypothetical protein [Burkholderia pseudomallei]